MPARHSYCQDENFISSMIRNTVFSSVASCLGTHDLGRARYPGSEYAAHQKSVPASPLPSESEYRRALLMVPVVTLPGEVLIVTIVLSAEKKKRVPPRCHAPR